MIAVLQVDETNKAKVLAAAKANPRLFFVKATAEDLAMDLDGNKRTMKRWSPYQALFGTGDKDLLAEVKPYLESYLSTLRESVIFNNETYKNGADLAIQQVQEKFPNGFDFPPSADEFNRLVNALAVAVTHDAQLREQWNNPNAETLILLEQVRKYLKPGIVETGHHYNMNEMIRTHEIYKQHWEQRLWDWHQLVFWSVFMIGFQQRLMTAPYLQAALMGLDKYVNKNQPLERCFELMNNFFTRKKVTVVPFAAEDSSCRLGESFFIDGYDGRGVVCWRTGRVAFFGRLSLCALSFMENHVKQTQRSFQPLCTGQRNKCSIMFDRMR